MVYHQQRMPLKSSTLFLDALQEKGKALLGLTGSSPSPHLVVQHALRHQILGLLWYDTRNCRDEFLQSVAQAAMPSALKISGVALANRRFFAEFLGKCKSSGVTPVLLKGVALNEYLYPGYGLRGMSDVDFLVHESDVGTASSVLEKMGMAMVHRCEYHAKWCKQLQGFGRIALECHWSIVHVWSRFPLKPWRLWESDIWTSAIDKEFDGIPVLVLCPEHALIYACITWHFDDYRASLRHMLDLYMLIVNSNDLDWDRVGADSRRWRASAIVYLALTEMTTYFDVEANIKEKIAGLRPSQFLEMHGILPMLRIRIDDELARVFQHVSLTEFPDWRSRTSARVAPVFLAICSGEITEITKRLLPSRERVLRHSKLDSTRPALKHYVRYYIDLLPIFFRYLGEFGTEIKRWRSRNARSMPSAEQDGILRRADDG